MRISEIYLPVPKESFDDCRKFYEAIGLRIASDEDLHGSSASIGFTKHKSKSIGQRAIICLQSDLSLREICDLLSKIDAQFECIMDANNRKHRIRLCDPAENLILISPSINKGFEEGEFQI